MEGRTCKGDSLLCVERSKDKNILNLILFHAKERNISDRILREVKERFIYYALNIYKIR